MAPRARGQSRSGARGRGRGRGHAQNTSVPEQSHQTNPFLSPPRQLDTVSSSPQASRGRGRGLIDRGRSDRGNRSRSRGVQAHSYNIRNNSQAQAEVATQQEERTLRSGRKYSTSQGPLRARYGSHNKPESDFVPNQLEVLAEQNEEQRLQFGTKVAGAQSSSWSGTPSEILLHAAKQLNQIVGADLPDDTLKEIVRRAQRWIVERASGGAPDYQELAGRLISEGVIAVLVFVTGQQGHLAKASECLHPFGSSIEQHFKASGFASPFASTDAPVAPSLELAPSLPPQIASFLEVTTAQTNDGAMATPTIDQFLAFVRNVVSSGDGQQLRDWLPIEPPFTSLFENLIKELRMRYARSQGAHSNAPSEALIEKVETALKSVKTSTDDTWTGFAGFIAQYLVFIRDVDPTNLLETWDSLAALMRKSNVSMGTPDVGVVMLPTTIAFAKMFARLSIGLDKRPELIADFVVDDPNEGGEDLSLPKQAADIVRTSLVSCLQDRHQYSPSQPSGPKGLHAGIYKFANICLKISFECKKTKTAETIYNNIGQKSPPIEVYPRADRVTYLYYLGRSFFSANHFFRAQVVLQAAYDECARTEKNRQRRLILIYLLTSNLILGRFPSASLYSRPEAWGLRERFEPICNAIRKGDLPTFRRLTDMHTEHAEWFLFHRIFLQIKSRCEVLVWRSLSRRVWLLAGDRGDVSQRKPPFLELGHMVIAAKYLEQRALNPSMTSTVPGARHTNWIFMSSDPPKEAKYVDPDFEGLEEDDEYFDEEGVDEWNPFLLPGMPEVESIIASLISQGLIFGYVSSQKKLAIMGAGKRSALEAGWPNVWQTIKSRCEKSAVEIPGWVRGRSGGFQGGVVNLSGARPAGS